MADPLVRPLRYESYADVNLRLDSTYVRYKNVPYYCKARADSAGDLHVMLTGLSPDVDPVVVHSSSVHLDISSMPLGFVPHAGRYVSCVVEREPVRRQKQGISVTNLRLTKYNVEDPDKPTVHESARIFDHIPRECFYLLLRNEFPKFKDAFNSILLVSTKTGAPISRLFSIQRTKDNKIVLLDLHFEEVGVFNEKGQLKINEWWATPTMTQMVVDLGIEVV